MKAREGQTQNDELIIYPFPTTLHSFTTQHNHSQLLCLHPFRNNGNSQNEIIRVFVCITSIHIRLAKMKYELLTTPFLGQFDDAMVSKQKLQDEVKWMTALLQPAIEAVENPDPGFTPDNSTMQTPPPSNSTTTTGVRPVVGNNTGPVSYVDSYRAKLREQCLYQINETQRVCRQNYTHLYLDCVERVTLLQGYCDAFKVDNYCSVQKVRRIKIYLRKLSVL